MSNYSFYKPQEDSFLFQKTLKEKIYPNVSTILDIGVGTGILTQTAHEMYPLAHIDGIDINENAIKHAKIHCAKQISFFQSNLFENVTKKYDLIICNPPYLPQHHLDPDDIYTKALVGGKKGYEYTLKILEQAQDYLQPNGRIILMLTSLANPNHVLQKAQELLYETKLLVQKRVGLMEDLHIYEFKPFSQLQNLQNHGLQHITYLAKGKRGVVLQGIYQQQKVAIKIPHQHSNVPLMIHKEAENLQKVNKLGIGPKYVFHTQEYVVREFIDGKRIRDYIKIATHTDKIIIIKKILKQLRLLDIQKLQKEELTNPYKHILITENQQVYQIDFERMTYTQNPKNITQFFQYILKKKILPHISQKECQILLVLYKKNQSDDNYQSLIKLII